MDDIIKISKDDIEASRAIVLKEIGEDAKTPKIPEKPSGLSLKEKVMEVISPSSAPHDIERKPDKQIDLLKALSQDASGIEPALPEKNAIPLRESKKSEARKAIAVKSEPTNSQPAKNTIDISPAPIVPAISKETDEEKIDLEAIEKQLDLIKIEPVSEIRPKYKVRPFSSRKKKSLPNASITENPQTNPPTRAKSISGAKRIKNEKPVPIRIVSDHDDGAFIDGVFLGFKFMATGCFFFLLSYVTFILSILIFNYDTPLSRKISRVIPVPAVVSFQAVIDYYDYADFLASLPEGVSEADALKDLSEFLVTGELAGHYGLSRSGKTAAELESALNDKVLHDEKLNGPALARINKIKELANGDNFSQVATQYGEEFKQTTMKEVEAIKVFGNGITSLKPGEISGAIASSNGFYVVKLIGKNDGGYSMMSVFVKGLCLKEYIEEKVANERLWVLADIIKKGIE